MMDIHQIEVVFCKERGVSSFIEYAALPDDNRERRNAEALERFMAPIRTRRLEVEAQLIALAQRGDEPASVNRAIRYQVLRRDNYCCQICGRSHREGVILEVDHKIAQSKGGSNRMENLWTLCRACNRGKSDLDL